MSRNKVGFQCRLQMGKWTFFADANIFQLADEICIYKQILFSFFFNFMMESLPSQ